MSDEQRGERERDEREREGGTLAAEELEEAGDERPGGAVAAVVIDATTVMRPQRLAILGNKLRLVVIKLLAAGSGTVGHGQDGTAGGKDFAKM